MTSNVVASPPAPDVPALSVDAARLLGRIEKFASIGRNASGGIEREGFSDADREARAELIREAEAAGLAAGVDAAGNILIRRPEGTACTERPTLLIGSHLDTVVNGGRLDGTYGVLAALEVLQTVLESGVEPAHEPVAVAFANEEGARFPQPFWGSKVLVGRLAELPEEPLAHDGTPLRDALARVGGDLDALGTAVWSQGSVAAYLELHVEQGPVLESSGDSIGVVTGITGRTVLTVVVRGEAGHAGTTPMEMRRDPLAAAARILLAVEGLAQEQQLCRVATVGRLDIRPNSPNTIAEEVQLTVDLRDGNPVRLELAEQAVRNLVATVAQERRLEIDVEVGTRTEPAQADRTLRDAIADSAVELGHRYQLLPSGAGHDAQIVAEIAPMGMIFVPSIGGVSHVPEEDTKSGDLVAGADVLLRTALRL